MRSLRLPRVADWVLPGCLALLAIVEMVRVDAPVGDAAIQLTISLGMCGCLVWRRLVPLPMATVAGALFAAYAVIDGSLPESLVQAVALLVGAYALAAHAAIRPAVIGLAIVVAAGVWRSVLMDYDAGSVVVNSAWGVVAWGLGRAMRARDRRVSMAELAAAETELLRDATERAAALAERRRIARELHDVVAHAVTVIVVQARGARRWIDTDPQEVRAALDAIEEVGSDAIDELRRMLALLDDSDEGDVPDAVRSGPAELSALVERVRAAGLPVTLEVTGEAAHRVASIDVSAYRVVQEALTNALRHGEREPARVVVNYLPDRIDVHVDSGVSEGASSGERAGTGRGLIGLRERVRLTGGSLDVGVDEHGRYSVHAVLPFEGQPA